MGRFLSLILQYYWQFSNVIWPLETYMLTFYSEPGTMHLKWLVCILDMVNIDI